MPSLKVLHGKPLGVKLALLPALAPTMALNALFDLATGGQRRAVFLDVATTAPKLAALEHAHGTIRQELLALLDARVALPPAYEEIDRIQYGIAARVNPERKWRVFLLDAMGERPAANVARCPRTMALLAEVPDLFQAFFSILEPGKSIPAHEGPYRGYLRYHLGLVVPHENPPSIRVKDRHYTWKVGEGVLFDDSWEHEVTNAARELRAVLVVDVLRPLPWPLDWLNRRVRAALRWAYGRKLKQNADRFAEARPFID